ncbi:hypothetical protein V6N12_066207 [Hibiscus sabdariffa]|uniref:Pentatricopeptide repeat-containing protein n=1 Tax=Hibiscus sabdariffa TaxID=183260 RepID=A0ABR2B9N9_9ROSI
MCLNFEQGYCDLELECFFYSMVLLCFCAVCICSQGMLSDEAWEYFSSMTTDHYVHMVHLLGHAELIKEAEELILSMPFQPGASVWQTLLNACQVH